MKTIFHKVCSIHLLVLLSIGCRPAGEETIDERSEVLNPDAKDSFVMRNPEIREDLLNQLVEHNIVFWTNEDGSIGFYVRDTKEVDRLANEAIGVYISLQ